MFTYFLQQHTNISDVNVIAGLEKPLISGVATNFIRPFPKWALFEPPHSHVALCARRETSNLYDRSSRKSS